ncbi:MAG: hypothetical protein E7317_07320 [Clostridiales bacterium]|nr:hypothetical protein [Clostridiales bacterium]
MEKRDPSLGARDEMARAEQTAKADPARPKRYRLYDRIAAHATVGMMNVIIIAAAALLVLALVIGIATGTR